MAKRHPFDLVYAAAVIRHLLAIETKHHSEIKAGIEEQLLFEPDVETKNRKPLHRPVAFAAEWELRLGRNNRFRVFYQVISEIREVHILAIGVKDNNRLRIGGEDIEL